MMNNVDELKQAVERLHNCKASHIEDVVLVEKFGEKTVWGGVVSVFEIKGHSQATKCYAWSSPIEGSTKRKFFAVLHASPVTSAEDAVRAAIIREYKSRS